MKLLQYLRDKIISLLMLVVSILLVSMVLYVYGVTFGVIVLVDMLFLSAIIAGFSWDYLIRRRFYSDLLRVLETENSPAYYLTESLNRPPFLEGSITYDALMRATKDMNDVIASYRLSSDEYREYVESWIHEIKTPIAASRLVLANRNDETAQVLNYEYDRVEAHLEQALYYSRSTAVEKDYFIKSVDLDAVVKGVVKKQARSLIEYNITPQFDDLDITVYSDAKWLDFIIGQIVANAVKYHRPQNADHQPTIKFSAEHHNGGFESERLLLRIYDNGIGIPATDIDRIFEKSFTGENGRRYSSKSTGIGLYLCKKLCAKMQLGLTATSTKGETILTIEFPLSKVYFLDH